MKTFLILLTFLIIFGACSRNNAFDRFHMNPDQERTLNSLQSSKIKYKNRVNGSVHVVYLNQVDPEKYINAEVFYIYMYLKDKSEPVSFSLNGEQPSLSVRELTSNNEFTALTSVDTQWNRYYIVSFAEQGDILKFKVKNGVFTSNTMLFEKDE
jgi:hypothetical protein